MHFFISRAGQDSDWAKWIASTLEEEGHTTTVQDFDFRPGHSFLHQMKEAIDKADHFIAVLSDDYFEMPFTLKELYSGIASDPIGRNRTVIPVRVRPCQIPGLFTDLVYIDLVGKSAETARSDLLDGIRPEVERTASKFPGGDTERRNNTNSFRTRINNLPSVDSALYGRGEELRFLDKAFADAKKYLVQIIASGGTGKTAVFDRWFRKHSHKATVFAWSFYKQGNKEQSQLSSDDFFAEALAFFRVNIAATASVYLKAELLSTALQSERAILLLDGIEPLQNNSGALHDSALRALLQQLTTLNAGLVICTSRVQISDIQDDPPKTVTIYLENLDPESSAEYLRHLGVKGSEKELLDAAAEYGHHALALTLLGSYLSDFYSGDVNSRHDIPALMIKDVRSGEHARRVMQAYANMLEGTPELEVLRALGYFDRAAELNALQLLIPDMADAAFRGAIKRLERARLVLPRNIALELDTAGDSIDCHPLIREHFAEVVRLSDPEGFRIGNERLYRYYVGSATRHPVLRADF